MVTGLWGAGLSTDQIAHAFVAGDVVLYPKFQMLVANSEALAGLTAEERATVDAIVAEVHRLALGRQFTEAELAAGICEIGGTVVEAGPEALEALRAAARPLFDEMAAEPVMGDIIGRIVELAGQTPDGPEAGTCGPAPSANPTAAADVPPVSEPELAGYTGTELPPSGTYRTEMVREDMAAAGASTEYAAVNDGTWTWRFEGDTWQADRDRNSEHCSGTIEVVDGNVRFLTVVSQGCGMDYDVRWRLDGDELSLRLADLPWAYTPTDFANERIFIDRVWTRIDEPAESPSESLMQLDLSGLTGSALVPDGIYRAVVSAADLETAGAGAFFASVNDGTWTMTVTRDGWELTHTGNRAAASQAAEACSGTQAVVESNVRFTTVASKGCGFDGDHRWRLEGDALTLRYAGSLSSLTPADLADARAWSELVVWTRIEGVAGANSSSVPPEGTYRAEITVEELEATGASREAALNNAGVVTWAVHVDGGRITLVSEVAPDWECAYTWAQAGETMDMHLQAGDCDPGVYAMTFELETDRLTPTVVSTEPARDNALVKAFFERPWIKVE
jgi:hypothetical protein